MEDAIKAKVLLVGGEETYADQFVIKAENHGIYLQKEAHIGWDDQPKTSFPQNIDVAIVLKDICNHKLRDWTRKEARKNNIRFCEISQKISVGIAGLRHCLGLDPSVDAPSFEETKIPFTEPSSEYEVIKMTHEGICEFPTLFLPQARQYLVSKKKYLSRTLRVFAKIIGEGDASWNSIKNTKNNPFSILFDDYKAILKRELVGHELIREMVINVYTEMLENEASLFEIQRVLSFTFGVQLSKEQEQEIKKKRKPMEKKPMEKKPMEKKQRQTPTGEIEEILVPHVQEVEVSSDSDSKKKRKSPNLKKVIANTYQKVIADPVKYFSVSISPVKRLEYFRESLQSDDLHFAQQIFDGVLKEINTNTQKHHSHYLKKAIVESRDTWCRSNLSLRGHGKIEFSNSDLSKVHKEIWSCRVSDKTRLLFKSQPNSLDTVKSDVTEGFQKVFIGDYELEFKGELKIKEIKRGTRLEVLGEKKITIEGFDGEVIKGVTIK